MLVGYNHNILYKGDVFHVQTEDSGINNPHIITLLYRGGNILASKKTSYSDIIKMGNLQQVVEELMKEQHKGMLRSLKNGEFDDRLGKSAVFETPSVQPLGGVQAETAPRVTAPKEQVAPIPPPLQPSPGKQSLDDLIFDFLSSADDRH